MRKKKNIPPLTAEQKQKVTTLYETYKGLMLHTARKFTVVPEDIEEILQDSLIALMKNIDTISSLNRCKTAAYIVLSVKRTYYNRVKKDRQTLSIPFEEDAIQTIVGNSSARNISLIDTDARLDVMYLMDALSENDRMALEAWYLEGYSADQLAAKMNCKPDSIRMILSRVRKRAAKILQETEVK